MIFLRTIIPKHILVNRVDAMGDVILAMPLCGLIKKYYPGCRISFLGRTYTRSIAAACVHIDAFINRDDWKDLSAGQVTAILKKANIDTVIHLLPDKPAIKACWNAKIKYRIGGTNKFYYLRYCNRLVRFNRKKSRLNEAQLNIKLLKAIGINELPPISTLHELYGFSKIPLLAGKKRCLLDDTKLNLILHPLSDKHAQEWGLHNFSLLINMLDQSRVKIFITGSLKEKPLLEPWISKHKGALTDLTGKLQTSQLIAFIAAADGLIASSTGPVHIAAASGINTLGLYENKWKKRGERWGPVGKNASYIECINDDMNTITPSMVLEQIEKWIAKKSLNAG